ncbi:MAG: RagB/SusD family nutrient uptake outer membrane protein [Prolixibacteraceae bacterium]|jgi:tetratricopeptide (TPR) repeat protein|nr:RagB/SusD family nutrient uptake outer membrane protein [Prolixibacteraceae bacterium]
MNRYKNISIIGLLFLVAFTSCEDFLYQAPKLSQTNELTLSTFDGIDKSVAGAYSPLYSSNWYGRGFVVTADLKGGNAKLSPISSGRFTSEYLWNNLPDATSNLWATAYITIARANNALEAIEALDETGITEDQINELKGECYFLRALAYHDLVRFYSHQYNSGVDGLGVPVVLITEIGTPSRNTIGEVYTQIVSDLKEAETLLGPAVSRTATDTKAYASNTAAQALLSRVYLYMEDWQNAADYASKVINSGTYSMYTATDFATTADGGIWGAEVGGAETIFEVYGSEGNSYHANWDVISFIMSPDGYGDVGASNDLISLYEAGDVRANLFVNTTEFPNDFWSLKYPGKDGNLREDNISVLRLSEMYLTRAEAISEGASVSGIGAVDDINMIRTNRGLAAISSVNTNDILIERRKELCFEGHQLFDLARTKRSLTRTDYDGAVNKDITFPDHRWAMPIPKAEIDANENMVQNDGY